MKNAPNMSYKKISNVDNKKSPVVKFSPVFVGPSKNINIVVSLNVQKVMEFCEISQKFKILEGGRVQWYQREVDVPKIP